ncbi:MAG: TonB-dependent receptor [Chitinophagaceae bacterium]|nr:TonB-dependent receptor [Chitinophagaceae bacterium]MCW5926019.1 TonB-dependent receptor [Chitinophagaceae bacterium]
MKSLVLFLLFTGFALIVHAQSPGSVRGKVYDSSHMALPGATVILIKKGTADTLKTVTGRDGLFVFNNVSVSSFRLIISNAGMEEVSRDYDFEAGKTELNIGSITMQPAVTTLAEVIISPPPMVIKEDTVEFRADSFNVRPNSNVEDLLKKLPGLQVNSDGSITAQGKTVTKIKVNGKDFFGGDPKTATRELPADIVDKVQVVDDYGELAAASGIRDGDPDIIINLELKKDRNKGVFGRAAAGYGTDDRYQATLNANVFSENTQLSVLGNVNNINQNLFDFSNANNRRGGGGQMRTIRSGGGGGGNSGGDGGTSDTNANQNGITDNKSVGLNFRTDFNNKKGSFYGNYSYANRNTLVDRASSRQNIAGNIFTNNQSSIANNISNNHRANLNFEYNFDSLNYLKVIPNFSFSTSDNRTNGAFDYTNSEGFQTQEGYNADLISGRSPNFSTSINYNRRFEKRGRNLSTEINLGTSYSLSDDDKINFTREFLKAGGIDTTYLDQLITQDNANRNYGIRVRYSEPVSKNRFLDLSYNYNYSYAKIDRATYSKDSLSGNTTFLDSLSNAYENRFINQQVGISLRTVNKKYNYAFGVNLQPAYLSGYSISKDSAYTPQRRLNVAPSARLSYNFSRTKRLNLNYNANFNQPSFNQLQPVKDVSNPQYQTQGNPDLKPEFSHNLRMFFNNFNFTSGRTLFVGFNGNMVQNRIVNNNINLDSSGAQLSIPENVNGYYTLTGFYNYSIPFQNRRYVVSYNGTVNYNHDVGLVNSEKNIGNNWITTQRLNVDFNIQQWLELGVNGAYSLNSTQYTLTRNGERLSSNAWTLGSNMRLDIPGGLILRYDVGYVINNGLSSEVTGNPTLLNASIEKTIFKKKNGFIRLSGFDILNQNTNISRTVSGNAIIDSRVNRLTRYFMLTFTYRLMQFKGQQPVNMEPGGNRRRTQMNF